MSLSCCLAGKKSESLGVLDLTRLFPPFYCHSQVHYKLNVDVRSTEESRKTKGYMWLPVWHFWFFNSFSPRCLLLDLCLCQRWKNVCVPLLTFISFSSQRDETAHVLYVSTQSYLTHAFPWMCAAFQVHSFSFPLSLSAVLVPFSNWPDAFMCLNAQPELLCASEAMHQCCHWQNVHLL